MKRVQYVGERPQGITVRFPYPHVSKSAERGAVSFSKPGDVQEIESNQDAADLVLNGGGQFVYEATAEEKSAAAKSAENVAEAPAAAPASAPKPKATKTPKTPKTPTA